MCITYIAQTSTCLLHTYMRKLLRVCPHICANFYVLPPVYAQTSTCFPPYMRKLPRVCLYICANFHVFAPIYAQTSTCYPPYMRKHLLVFPHIYANFHVFAPYMPSLASVSSHILSGCDKVWIVMQWLRTEILINLGFN